MAREKATSTSTVYVFGDQTDDARSYLRTILHNEGDPLVECFLQNAYSRLRAEIMSSHGGIKTEQLQFASLSELLEIDFQNPYQVAVDHALTSISHFAMFMRVCHLESSGGYIDSTNTSLIGLCTGALTTAAVSCCRSVAELLLVSTEVSILSFRLGKFAAQTAALFQGVGRNTDEHKYHGTWAVAVSGPERDLVEEYLETIASQNPAKAFLPYVGVRSYKSITICGPPQALMDLTQLSHFKKAKWSWLPINAPYHAEHLYGMDTITCLLDEVRVLPASEYTGIIPVIPSPPGNFRLIEALSNAAHTILTERMDMRTLAKSLTSQLPTNSQSKLHIVAIASTAGSALQQELEASNPGMKVTLSRPNLQSNSSQRPNTDLRCKIAIVGSSGRFPGSANNEDAFWDILLQGRDVHTSVPASRWNVLTHVDQSEHPRKNTSATPFGCWLEDAGLFDAKFFGMSPREAEQTDPAQRLALMVTYEALEDGGIVPGRPSTQPSRVGVAIGVTSNDWMETNTAQNIDTYLIPGGNRAFIPGRINYAFKFSGPSYAVDTACSSSLAAIDIACKVLRMREADTMIAGGTNIITNPDFTAGLDKGFFLSRTGNCKTFDDNADGYCRGEGVGIVILKRLEDAVRDGDSIKGVIVDVRTNHSAEANSITRPYPKAQGNLLTQVLNGMNPNKISYVEMHGTGTQVGDAAEMSSVSNVIAPYHGSGHRSVEDVVYVGSVKANVGHGEASAGVTGLLKLLLMLQHNTIPPHVGIKTHMNRKFPSDLIGRGIRIASSSVSWTRPGADPRYALLNNFSAAGGNTAMLIEDAPVERMEKRGKDPRDVFPITISAKGPSALYANAHNLRQFIQQKPSLDLPSLSYTTTARRSHHSHRFCLSVRSTTELDTKLFHRLNSITGTRPSSISPKLCFVFTGQGGHYMGMGRDLYHSNAFFRADIDRYNVLADSLGFLSFLPLITGEHLGHVTDCSAEVVQLAHASLQMALHRLWVSLGVSPCSVIGHSLGHYAALCAAKVLSEADTLFLVGTRARLIQKRCRPGSHSMLAVQADITTVEQLSGHIGIIDVACINGPQSIVLSGSQPDISSLEKALMKQGISSTFLDTQFAFHSSQVDCVLGEFRAAIQCVNFGTAHMPILCPLSGTVVQKGCALDSDHLVDHLRGRVNVVSALEKARLEGIVDDRTYFVEIGHKATMTSILKDTLGGLCNIKPSLKRNLSCWGSMTDCAAWLWEAGVNVRWELWHRDFVGQLHVLRLPSYNWDLKNYWIPYTNDWSLRKGDPTQVVLLSKPSLISRTIHMVLREDITKLPASMTLKSDLNKPEMREISRGHKVNGVPLCTPSLYAEIALNVGRYLQMVLPEISPSAHISIRRMKIIKALVTRSKGTQWLQTVISVDKNMFTTCIFSTVDDNGGKILDHATCDIVYEQPMAIDILNENTQETIHAIHAVRAKQAEGRAYRFNANMVYRMVATLAKFDAAYRGLEEIVLDSETMAAVGLVKFRSTSEDKDQRLSRTSPAHLDSFTQLAGFVMNANESSDLETECFVNHGWESMTLYAEMSKDTVYECFIEMQKQEGTIWKGTLHVISAGTLVAIFKDIQMQGVPPRLLSHILDTVQSIDAPVLKPRSCSYRGMEITQEHVQLTRAVQALEERSYDHAGLDKLVNIVAEESGVKESELHDDTRLADLGVDSLLSLLIASRLKVDLEFDLGSGIALFEKFETLGQLKDTYARSHGSLPQTTPSVGQKQKGISQVYDRASQLQNSPLITTPGNQCNYTARSVSSLILQSASASERVKLFLFPDGSGSAASYLSLPNLSSDIEVIALVSPYRHDADNMACNLESLLKSYIAEIKRCQPTDGYTLGGWSSGGVFAFCVAQMLLNKGSTIDNIILLDSPPLEIGGGLGRLPNRFYDHCLKVGIFGQIGVRNGKNDDEQSPERLIKHFKATVNLLAEYQAAPLKIPSDVRQPRVSLCWAGRCALDGTRFGSFEVEAGDTDDVKFLAEPRNDFGPGAWAKLFPGIDIRVETLQPWDHFNMMVGQGAKDLANFVTSCVEMKRMN